MWINWILSTLKINKEDPTVPAKNRSSPNHAGMWSHSVAEAQTRLPLAWNLVWTAFKTRCVSFVIQWTSSHVSGFILVTGHRCYFNDHASEWCISEECLPIATGRRFRLFWARLARTVQQATLLTAGPHCRRWDKCSGL